MYRLYVCTQKEAPASNHMDPPPTKVLHLGNRDSSSMTQSMKYFGGMGGNKDSFRVRVLSVQLSIVLLFISSTATVVLEVMRHTSGYHVSLQSILSSYHRHVTAVRNANANANVHTVQSQYRRHSSTHAINTNSTSQGCGYRRSSPHPQQGTIRAQAEEGCVLE